jgi:hypothetical protein
MRTIFPWDDIRIGLIEDYGIIVVARPVSSLDKLDQYERCVEYVTMHSDKTAAVPYPTIVPDPQ